MKWYTLISLVVAGTSFAQNLARPSDGGPHIGLVKRSLNIEGLQRRSDNNIAQLQRRSDNNLAQPQWLQRRSDNNLV